MVGANARHGPHQGAQKSTSTGTLLSATSFCQLSLVNSTTFALAMNGSFLGIGGAGEDRKGVQRWHSGSDKIYSYHHYKGRVKCQQPRQGTSVNLEPPIGRRERGTCATIRQPVLTRRGLLSSMKKTARPRRLEA